jgi:chromosomal replication initiation ATPase DnaA
MKLDHIENNILIINVKNLFAKQVLTTDFLKPITKILSKHLNTQVEVVFKMKEENYSVGRTQQQTPITYQKINNINKNYNFDNFVVTEFNKSAYNAAQSIFKKIY